MDIKLAVLIDGDNIPSAYIKEMDVASGANVTMAIPIIKRIYGD
jgi:hypothetical protein